MNLYIIARKDTNHYLAGACWNEDNSFHWTADIFFSVFGSDREAMELYYAKRLSQYPGWLSAYHVREMTETENRELCRHQCYHHNIDPSSLTK